MRIVIAGAGDVGFHLAKLLALESQDTTIIDTDKDTLDYMSTHLDVHTISGSCTSFNILKEARVEDCDLYIAVTSSEEVNFTSAVISKRLGAKKTIVRVNNVEFMIARDSFMEEIGIDEVILPETLAAKEIMRLVNHSVLTDHFSFERGQLALMGIKIDEESKLLNRRLKDLYPNGEQKHFKNVAVLRKNETLIPDKDMVFRKGDHTYFIADKEGEQSVFSITNQEQRQIKRIMILGGSKIGYHAARLLSKKYSVKLIEEDRSRCKKLADRLNDTLIIQGDPRNIELLEEEDLNEMDVVIAVTDKSETNIISCLMAKNHGVFKTIALVENMDYIHLSQSVGVDTMINKRLIAANFIFRHIRKGDVLAMAGVHGADCEVLEFEVNPKDSIYHKSIKKLKFPPGAKIGGVVRNGEGIIPDDDFMFRDKDLVVVLSKPECIHKVERLFF